MNFDNSRRQRSARQGARRSERRYCDDEQRRIALRGQTNYEDSLRDSTLWRNKRPLRQSNHLDRQHQLAIVPRRTRTLVLDRERHTLAGLDGHRQDM